MKILNRTYHSFLDELKRREGKSFGLLLSNQETGVIDDYYIFVDDNRQLPSSIENFNKFGKYYEYNKNAGFLATVEESYNIETYCIKSNKKKIAMFHVHLRHPEIFTFADWELHPSSSLKHLIISFRNPNQPKIKVFSVNKNIDINEVLKINSLSHNLFKEENLELVDDLDVKIDFFSENVFTLDCMRKKELVDKLEVMSIDEKNFFWKKYRKQKSMMQISNPDLYNSKGIKKNCCHK